MGVYEDEPLTRFIHPSTHPLTPTHAHSLPLTQGTSPHLPALAHSQQPSEQSIRPILLLFNLHTPLPPSSRLNSSASHIPHPTHTLLLPLFLSISCIAFGFLFLLFFPLSFIVTLSFSIPYSSLFLLLVVGSLLLWAVILFLLCLILSLQRLHHSLFILHLFGSVDRRLLRLTSILSILLILFYTHRSDLAIQVISRICIHESALSRQIGTSPNSHLQLSRQPQP